MPELASPARVKRLGPAHFPLGKLTIGVFGPGKGEAIVLRLPDGRFAVVDGCREPSPGAPRRNPTGRGDPVRELLGQVEKDGQEIKLAFVCMTHPHDDHYAGLARLIAAYEGQVEQVWTTDFGLARDKNALIRWLKLTRAGAHPLPDSSEIKGLVRLIEAFESQTGGPRVRDMAEGLCVEIAGCSICMVGPSTIDIRVARRHLYQALVDVVDGNKVPGVDPNDSSVALYVRWGDAGVLLGGDLTNGECEQTGWSNASQYLDGPVQVVKVAHHASSGAHHTDLWGPLDPSLALVTPFLYAKVGQPPQPEMLQTLAAKCTTVVTTPPDWFDPAKATRTGGVPVPGRVVDNAVAVTLDKSGSIASWTLAGAADVYDERCLAEK